jgi:hypothetical protein
MALQPFVGPWPLLQFRNLFYTVGRTPWASDQPVARPLPTHRTAQTQNKHTHTDKYALSGIRTHDPSVRASDDNSCLRPRGNCDQLLTCITAEISELRSAYNNVWNNDTKGFGFSKILWHWLIRHTRITFYVVHYLKPPYFYVFGVSGADDRIDRGDFRILVQ